MRGGREDYSYSNDAFVEGLRVFLDYTDPGKPPPKEGLAVRRLFQREEFEKRCIQRWVISELVELISANPSVTAAESSYAFAMKLLQFKEVAPDEKTKRIFSIAEDFIENEVLDIFRMEEGIYP